MQGLQAVHADLWLRLFYPIDQVRLQPEFLRKDLYHYTAFRIAGCFKYNAAGFMKHRAVWVEELKFQYSMKMTQAKNEGDDTKEMEYLSLLQQINQHKHRRIDI